MRKLLIIGLFGVAVVGTGSLYAQVAAIHLKETGLGPTAQTRLAQTVDEDDEDNEDVQQDFGPAPDDQDSQDSQDDPDGDDEDDDSTAVHLVGITT